MAGDLISGWRVSRAAPFVLALTLLASGCATAPAPIPQRTEEHAEAAYLRMPLRGYPRSMTAADAEELRAGHDRLISAQESGLARQLAQALLDRNPQLEPATILLAQADFIDGGFEAALDLVTPIAERYPDYVAAQLLAGRAAEKLERVKEAFEAYSRIAARSGLAARQADALRSRAVEVTGNRAEDLLSRGRLEEAAREVEQLEAWAPSEVRTLELVARYSVEASDPGRELEAVRQLVELGASSELLRRQALLELEAGDSGEGLRILEELVERSPGDPRLATDLERAKFRWRLNLLPEDVVRLLRKPELSRADHAKLLFWLFPDVRYGRATEGRIASDILDHPHRQEIARVVNLGLMRVDLTLHLFHPERTLRRRDALQSILRILAGRRPRPACLGDLEPRARLSVETLCHLSARCGLLREASDCLPEARASGRFVEGVGFAALDASGSE